MQANRHRSSTAIWSILLVPGLLLAACSDNGERVTEPDPGNDVDDEVVEVQLTAQLTFSPSEVEISPGTTVRWVNAEEVFHTVTPDGHSEWDRREMRDDGETFEHTFDQTGDFAYLCEPHLDQGMTGRIVVE